MLSTFGASTTESTRPKVVFGYFLATVVTDVP